MKASKVYICGRISGKKTEDVIEEFAERSEYWRSLGFEVVNPIEVTPFIPGKTWEEYMKDCLEVLVRCDYIAPSPAWMTSKGARIEMRIAEELKIQVVKEW